MGLEDGGESPWEAGLRKMLPPGAPLPDDDHLDYSIALDYDGTHSAAPKVEHFDCGTAADNAPGRPAPPPRGPRFSRHRSVGWPPRGSPREVIRSFFFSRRPSESDAGGNAFVASPRTSSARDTDFLSGLSQRPQRESAACDGAKETHEELSEGDEGTSAAPVGKDRKKTACSRCGKGSIFTEKEVCLVCDARYCSNCLLKAMGSMPEGRKCVGCIGRPINESRRSGLGKSSKILCKLCNPLEVRQIMKAERECPANQLSPDQVVVNGRVLRQEELDELLGCSMPPQKLKPGRYWYDKDSGLWGKDGDRPDRIISPKLNIGGKLKSDASNGNTQVFINGREITKLELRVLKLANVQCQRDTHFWVYDDGSYEEEGQNNIRGKIWEKASTRLICSLFSLPTPEFPSGSLEDASVLPNRSIPEYLEQRRVQKLLLLGLEGSGTSTIFKQKTEDHLHLSPYLSYFSGALAGCAATVGSYPFDLLRTILASQGEPKAKRIYGNEFTPEEVENMKLMIQFSLYRYLSTLLEARERFEEEALVDKLQKNGPGTNDACKCVFSINQRLKHFSDWLLQIMAMGSLDAFFPAAAREYAPLVEEIWRDPAIQETYKRRNELHLPDVASYFLDRAVEISSNEFEPTEKDILYAEGFTQGHSLAVLEFSLDDKNEMPNAGMKNTESLPQTKYQLIRVSSKGISEGCKWLEMFEDVRVIIFCVSLSDYDQMWDPGSGELCNKMISTKELFKTILSHPSFRDIPFVLLLNKYDAFEEKINKVPLSICQWFADFRPVKSHSTNQSLATSAYFFIAVKFKDLYASINNRKLFVFQMKARERATVSDALKYIREVLKWDDMKDENIFGVLDESTYSAADINSTFL